MPRMLWLIAAMLPVIGCVPENRAVVNSGASAHQAILSHALNVCASYGYPSGTEAFGYCVERTYAAIQHSEYCRQARSGFGDIGAAASRTLAGQGQVSFAGEMDRIQRARGC